MDEQQASLLWYTRREGVIRGPYSAEIITRYILLGRIRLQDELSRDRTSWSAAGQLTTLLPEQLHNVDNPNACRELMIAQLLADERRGERRRPGCKNCGNCRERRELADRRQPPGSLPVGFQPHFKASRKPRQTHLRTLLLVMLLAGMMLALLVPSHR